MTVSRAEDHGFHRSMSMQSNERSQTTLDFEASEGERETIAAWLETPSVKRLTAHVERHPWRGTGLSVAGRFAADVERVCGVSLERFDEHVEGSFERRFHPDIAPPPEGDKHGEITLDLGEDDSEPMPGHALDVGTIVAEELSLALEPFPRKPGAALESAAAEVLAKVEKPNPFAALAKLKDPEAGA